MCVFNNDMVCIDMCTLCVNVYMFICPYLLENIQHEGFSYSLQRHPAICTPTFDMRTRKAAVTPNTAQTRDPKPGLPEPLKVFAP